MKIITIETLTDQKHLASHVIILILSIIITIYFSFVNQTPDQVEIHLVFFLWLFFQIEAFLLIARLIFGRIDLEEVKTRGQITKRVIARFIVFYLACLAAAFILYLVFKTVISSQTDETFSTIWNNFITYEFRGWFKTTTAGLVFGGIVLITVLWQDALKREQKLREENLIFQNETLKNQVNPHFLFNSLNTISSLIQSQPEAAEKFIKNLSSFYRYILENGQKNRVPLNSELDFLKEYFRMHEVRGENKIFLNIDIPEPEKYEIMPVSLQILIENAIKHNMTTRENPLTISIYIEDHKIVVKNNLQKMSAQIRSTGIGLKNLTERIRLITGKDLIINESDSYYVVKIPLLT